MVKLAVKHKENMNIIEFRKPYELGSIVKLIADYILKNDKSTREYYYLYSETDESKLKPEFICYAEEGPQITDDDQEIYPDFVNKNSLHFFYECGQFEGVIMNVLHQKKDATIDEYILALDYYSKHDTFKDISSNEK